MKHDFRTRKVAPLKTVPVGTCNCVDCQKSRVYGQMMGKRMQPYTNADNATNLTINNHGGAMAQDQLPP